MAREKEVACCQCGCTENNACGMGCWWVRAGDKPLCSNPICQLMDALEWEAAAVLDEVKRKRRRPLAERKKVYRAMRKLIREIKKGRGDPQ